MSDCWEFIRCVSVFEVVSRLQVTDLAFDFNIGK